MGRHTKRSVYKVGHLRVWVMDHIPCGYPTLYPVKSSAHGKKLIEALADSQLLDPNITDNAFGLERMDIDGDWIDWEDDNGASITDEDCVVSDTDGGR
jgi:hypothetical protein